MKPMARMAAVAVVGVVGGFFAGKSVSGGSAAVREISGTGQTGGSSTRPRPRGERPVSSNDEMLAKFLNGRSIQSLSAEEIASIVAEAMKYDSDEDPLSAAKRSYQLQLLLSKLSTGALAELSKTILTGDPKTAGRGYAVFNAWARRDWAGALAWADGEPGASRWSSMAIAALATTDSGHAADLINDRLFGGKMLEGYSAIYGVAQAKAKLGKNELLQFLDTLPASQQSNALTGSLRELPEQDLLPMLDEIYKRKNDKTIQDYSFTNALSELMRNDPGKAKAWIDQLENGDERAKLNLQLAGNFATNGRITDTLDMLQRAIEQSPGKEKEYIAKVAAQNAIQSPQTFIELKKLLPEGQEFTAEDLKITKDYFAYGRAGGLVDMAKLLKPEEQAKLLTTSIDWAVQNYKSIGGSMRFNDNDLKILENRITELGLTGRDADAVNSSLAQIREAARPGQTPPR